MSHIQSTNILAYHGLSRRMIFHVVATLISKILMKIFLIVFSLFAFILLPVADSIEPKGKRSNLHLFKRGHEGNGYENAPFESGLNNFGGEIDGEEENGAFGINSFDDQPSGANTKKPTIWGRLKQSNQHRKTKNSHLRELETIKKQLRLFTDDNRELLSLLNDDPWILNDSDDEVNSNRQKLSQYERGLNDISIQLDKVKTDGSNTVRKKRKELVDQIEDLLSECESIRDKAESDPPPEFEQLENLKAELNTFVEKNHRRLSRMINRSLPFDEKFVMTYEDGLEKIGDKVDSVDAQGNPAIRKRRKSLVHTINSLVKECESIRSRAQ